MIRAILFRGVSCDGSVFEAAERCLMQRALDQLQRVVDAHPDRALPRSDVGPEFTALKATRDDLRWMLSRKPAKPGAIERIARLAIGLEGRP